LKDKQDDILDKNKTMDNVQKHIIYTIEQIWDVMENRVEAVNVTFNLGTSGIRKFHGIRMEE
jgi:hypothetical protein